MTICRRIKTVPSRRSPTQCFNAFQQALQQPDLPKPPSNHQAVFFPAFTRAHLALCAAAILLRAAAESVRLPCIGTTFCCAPAFARTFAQRALWAAAIRARAAAESLPLVPVCFPYALPNAASAAPDLELVMEAVDACRGCRKLNGALAVEVLKRALAVEGIATSGRDSYVCSLDIEWERTAMRSLTKLNRGKKYRNRIKTFDFLLSCHVKQFGYPPDVDPEKFHLVAPYVPDPECWVDLPWIDQDSGKQYEITTEGFHGSRGVARVKTYGEVLREYEFHLGAKSAGIRVVGLRSFWDRISER
jgi:hypothetical protein